MPNDTGGQFPTPQEVKLTDEVAPDLSAGPPIIEAPQPSIPSPYQGEGQGEVPKGQVGVQPTPATPPPTRHFPILTFFLILIATGAIAATYFFYQQSQNLNTQLEQLQQTIERQRVGGTPTPEIGSTLLPTPESTISATPTATAAATLSPTITQGPARSAFSDILIVISTAQKKYPNAQLLMITGAGVQSDSQVILKYWFRQTPADKKYLYVLREPGKDLSLVDQQVYVTPDNNIPPLNQLAEDGKLGLDLLRAHQIALGLCPTNFDCAGGTAEAKFINFNTLLWQITFKSTANAKPFVVQIDSKTEKIIYQSQ